MLKFLRKYNKWILAFFGTVLMVAWLAPQGFKQTDPTNQTIGTIDGEKIRVRDQHLAARELAALAQFPFRPSLAQRLGMDGENNWMHWLLLVHEADKLGLVGGKADGEDFLLNDIAPALAQGENDPARRAQMMDYFVGNAIGHAQMSRDDFYVALAKVRGIWRLQVIHDGMPRLSDRRAMNIALREENSAFIDYVVVPASSIANTQPEPDAATLEAFFNEHKFMTPAASPDGIGYTLQPRVKLEYIKLDKAKILAAIPLDPIKVNQAWRADRATYKGEFDVERPKVEEMLKEDKLAAVLTEAHRAVQAEIMRATRSLEPDGKYRKLPADWAANKPSWTAIAQSMIDQVKQATGVTLPAPEIVSLTDKWYTDMDLAGHEELGQTSMRVGSIVTPGYQVLLAARGTGRESEVPLPIQSMVPVAENFLGTPTGDRLYFTILDARPESPADSLDEIRSTVIADVKRKNAYTALTGRLEELKATAKDKGLEGLAADFTIPKVPVDPAQPDAREPLQVRFRAEARRQMISSASGTSTFDINFPEVRQSVSDVAVTLDPLKPVADQQAPVIAVALPNRLSVVVAKITALNPLTIDRFRTLPPRWFTHFATAEENATPPAQAPRTNDFSFEALRQRHTLLDRKGVEFAKSELSDSN